jgi:hypothetical protein
MNILPKIEKNTAKDKGNHSGILFKNTPFFSKLTGYFLR